MPNFKEIVNLNPAADTALTASDELVMIDTADGNAYSATAAQTASFVLGYGLKPLAFMPAASVTPTVKGQVVFELTDDETLTVKVLGSDDVVREVALTLVAPE